MAKKTLIFLILFLYGALISIIEAQSEKQLVKTGNPLVPGYFADPTIKKFGDVFYLYSTTDGIKLASGEPQVWISKDFVNWFNYEMDVNVPAGLTNVWAPDVVEGADGRYYLFWGNCQFGCNIYGYVSDSPVGPWQTVNNGKAVIEVGTGLKNLPALDAQYLMDDDGAVYCWFGTWCHLFGGMGWAQIDPMDMTTILKSGGVPMEQIPDAFEAPFVLKRNGKYFLMYSSGDCRLSSYAVHYSVSDNPEGPFSYGENSPILQSSTDGIIDSPGHHSAFKDNGDYYILYHRHNNPHSTGGMFRQICVDRLLFENDTTIGPVLPSNEGVGYLGPIQIAHENMASKASVSASSSYHLLSSATRFSKKNIDHSFSPEYATDRNNGTLWKAGSVILPQALTVDLGEVRHIKRVMTRFEYPTFYYQYKIETSKDNITWTLFADRTTNRRSGSPMIDDHEADARFVKITISGVEKTGLFAAIWEVEIYDALFDVPEYQNSESKDGPGNLNPLGCIVQIDAESIREGWMPDSIQNRGALGGYFSSSRPIKVKNVGGIKALEFDGESVLQLNKIAPKSLSWNAPFTVSLWVNNPAVGQNECVVTWNSRDDMLQGSYAALMYGTGHYGAVAHGDGYVDLAFDNVPESGRWHHFALVFDGMKEVVYVNGIPVKEQPINLFVKNSKILIGGSGSPQENFSGFLANIRLYDLPLKREAVLKLMDETRPKGLISPDCGYDN
ncbi:family 43 glycosylhydrolase [Thermophagus sp. OGC60D27]|uniref:family 43 glycosylhydrolase n=1 Tax=Thermophagus sp. OGC60D27 TaxID=3458415 RepID=UPI0040384AA2